jgi:glutamyl endopeptidase
MKLLSIIVPTHKAEKYIAKTICSVFIAVISCFFSNSSSAASETLSLSLKSINPIGRSFKNAKKLKIDLNINSQASLTSTKTFKAKKNLIASVYGRDDRVVVSDTTQAPWSNIAGLKIKFPDGQEFVGSGAAIDSTHIITAAHNVFLKNHGGLAEVNSLDVRFEKYGTAKVTKIRILEGWTKEDNWKLTNNQWKSIAHANDLALLTLDRPLENFTPCFQLETPAQSSLSSIKVNVSGYPDKAGIAWQNLQMKTASGTIDSISNDDYQFFYNRTLDTQGGQSGSPLWYLDRQTNRYKIVGVHVAGDEWVNKNFYNSATKITDDKLNLFLGWVKEDRENNREKNPF